MVLNGVESPRYDTFVNTSSTVFDSNARVHALFVRGIDIVRVEMDVASSQTA